MRLSALDQIKKLDLQKAALMETVRKEALSEVQELIKTLNSLGNNFELVEKGTKPSTVNQAKPLKKKTSVRKSTRRKGSRVGTRKPADIACPICLFKTTPPHDRRSHRSQSSKKAFSQKELLTRGLRKTS
ncbi:MAG: hypothetical protein ACR2PH_11055 [Desulfobulbia bacterium]